MNRFIHLLLFVTFILGACTPSLPATDFTLTPPTVTLSSPTKTLSPTATITPTLTPFPYLTPTITPTLTRLDQSIVDMPIATFVYNGETGCVMAPGEVFPLSVVINDALKTLDANAEGFVEGFWGTCSERSIALTIWFYIDKPTTDLQNYEALGSWIINVMSLLDTIPRNEYTIGAEPTVVNFRFYVVSSSEFLDVRVPIEEYWIKAYNKSGEEVFNMFYTKP